MVPREKVTSFDLLGLGLVGFAMCQGLLTIIFFGLVIGAGMGSFDVAIIWLPYRPTFMVGKLHTAGVEVFGIRFSLDSGDYDPSNNWYWFAQLSKNGFESRVADPFTGD